MQRRGIRSAAEKRNIEAAELNNINNDIVITKEQLNRELLYGDIDGSENHRAQRKNNLGSRNKGIDSRMAPRIDESKIPNRAIQNSFAKIEYGARQLQRAIEEHADESETTVRAADIAAEVEFAESAKRITSAIRANLKKFGLGQNRGNLLVSKFDSKFCKQSGKQYTGNGQYDRYNPRGQRRSMDGSGTPKNPQRTTERRVGKKSKPSKRQYGKKFGKSIQPNIKKTKKGYNIGR
jgi:hypothetical protein